VRARLALVVLAGAAGALAAAPPAAFADKGFVGRTSQDREATMLVDAEGMPVRVRFRIAGRCRIPRFRVRSSFGFSRPFDRATTDVLVDGGRFRRREGAYVNTTSAQISLRRTFDPADPAAERWSGTFRVRSVYRRRGRYVDTCRTGTVRLTLRRRQAA
jgi:hypothetical protein